ncbi:type II toxin-antitoxin system prevent-host-death family antitoxin [Planobispora takensis]|uniref:Antitoxin n=1 Tax=Planobispora takensis TaxID=1367882 RepID=A0A8J3T6M0_9ACTN|nr:type II toxin-antitoxin system prevent-host-death family antitoxin [Planobispora takensis]GII06126.1 hypothetical protein Pta02_81340 [Planobispora takensis]
MTNETLGIVEARKRLGPLVARAVHGHQPTTITRSDEERAVLISEEEYEELLRLRREREIESVTAAIAARKRGELSTHSYSSPDELYADLGLPVSGERS